MLTFINIDCITSYGAYVNMLRLGKGGYFSEGTGYITDRIIPVSPGIKGNYILQCIVEEDGTSNISWVLEN